MLGVLVELSRLVGKAKQAKAAQQTKNILLFVLPLILKGIQGVSIEDMMNTIDVNKEHTKRLEN